MSDIDKPVASTDSGSADQTDVESKKQDTVSYQSHAKLLGEHKKNKDELLKLKEQMEKMREEKLTEQGREKEYIEELRRKNKELEEKFSKKTNYFLTKVLEKEVELDAKRRGSLLGGDKLMKLADFSTINFTDDMTPDRDALTSILDQVEKENPFLFKKEAQAIKDRTPAPNGILNDHKPMTAMSKEEIIAKLVNGG